MSKKIPSEKILKALDEVQKVNPSTALIKRMEDLAVAYAKTHEEFTLGALTGIAASVLLLFAVNIYAVNSSTSKNDHSTNNTIVAAEDLIPTKFIYND